MDALLLHGLGGGPADMDSLAQELATMGVACHAPCLPGHGAGWEAFVRSHWNQWSAALLVVPPRPSGRTGPALAAGLESLATACGDLFPAQRGRAGDRALAGTRAGGLLAPYGRDSP